MKPREAIVPLENIERLILLIRGQRVLLDADLATLYGVTTKRLNEQVKRNRERFPGRFLFQLTSEEKAELVANCDHLKKLRFSPALPNAFTEYGASRKMPCLTASRERPSANDIGTTTGDHVRNGTVAKTSSVESTGKAQAFEPAFDGDAVPYLKAQTNRQEK